MTEAKSKSIRSKLLAEHEKRNPRRFAVELFIKSHPERAEQFVEFTNEWISLQNEGTPVPLNVLADLFHSELGLPEGVSVDAIRSWVKWRFSV
jgi:hypothetical protein